MSQKAEKYARSMARRVDKLERHMEAVTTAQTAQGVRITATEDDLAIYQAAISARELRQAAAEVLAAKERRAAHAAERERKTHRRNRILSVIAAVLIAAVCVAVVAKANGKETAEPAAAETPAAVRPAEPVGVEDFPEDPQEAEKIDAALLEQYGCPYALAPAVAQTERGRHPARDRRGPARQRRHRLPGDQARHIHLHERGLYRSDRVYTGEVTSPLQG